jgi:hypothetical protein
MPSHDPPPILNVYFAVTVTVFYAENEGLTTENSIDIFADC